jgi:uncharacterized coiled-coil DUF342 family protein
MKATDINKKLDSFNNLIQEFGTSNFTSKEIWNRQKEIAENFKAAQFVDEAEKITTTSKFQQLINQLKEKENQVAAANEKFSEEAEQLIVTMESIFAKQTDDVELDKTDFSELKKLGNQTFEYFKLPRWESKQRRETAWEKYSLIRNAIKDKEDKLYAKEREEKSKQISQSLEITEKLCVVVNACHPSTNIEELLNFVNRFHQFLQEANFIEGNAVWHLIEKPEDIKYSLRCRTETLNDIRNFITNYRDYLTREHKGQIFANIDALKTDLNKAWETMKEEQEVKKKERDEKRVEWNKKQQDFLKMLEGRLENQIAYKAKQESYLQNQNEFVKRFESRIPQQKEYIEKLHEQLIDLEKKHATAWTDSFKTKVEEWMKEKKDKIADVEKDIEILKEKIADINKKAEELPLKIKELDDSIIEIKSKIEEVKEKLKKDDLDGLAVNG